MPVNPSSQLTSSSATILWQESPGHSKHLPYSLIPTKHQESRITHTCEWLLVWTVSKSLWDFWAQKPICFLKYLFLFKVLEQFQAQYHICSTTWRTEMNFPLSLHTILLLYSIDYSKSSQDPKTEQMTCPYLVFSKSFPRFLLQATFILHPAWIYSQPVYTRPFLS